MSFLHVQPWACGGKSAAPHVERIKTIKDHRPREREDKEIDETPSSFTLEDWDKWGKCSSELDHVTQRVFNI